MFFMTEYYCPAKFWRLKSNGKFPIAERPFIIENKEPSYQKREEVVKKPIPVELPKRIDVLVLD